jgi:glycine dehydrogenase
MAGFYGIYHGPKGLETIATRIRNMALISLNTLKLLNYKLITDDMIFDTVTVDLKGFRKNAEEMRWMFANKGINIRKIDDSTISFTINEVTTLSDLQDLLTVFNDISGSNEPIEKLMNLEGLNNSSVLKPVPSSVKRQSAFMTQDVYNTIHSENQMMRFLYKLQLKDVSLTNSMIPLGSCTMKASPTTMMIPITWPEFTDIHPFAPKDQAAGFLEMIEKLKDYLKSVTGFDEVSLQPNSGAQGELAGLLTIKKYYQDTGHPERNIVLIPVSAHGTNPASCVLAGLSLVTVKCDQNGNVDLKDLTEKAKKNAKSLCALMITYPSTHGVFEEQIRDIAKVIHDNGGQVYMDGANMNAQCGLTSPGYIGADVCHLNLHKTFAMPHGGGGPGVGPIAVKKHLAPYLPSNVVSDPDPSQKSFGSIASAMYGSASILPISYLYIQTLGKQGVRDATANAILNSNYLLTKLKNHYKVLFTGSKGRCAHEFIIDMRPFKKFGVTEEDVAKRLMDYGFHAPTMSFPVGGTLMIEPTESEDQGELDRFCEALISIRKEIQDVETGKLDKKDNPLKNAPHCLSHVTANEWKHPYSREQAAFPLPYIAARGKFWPTVGRINNLLGDKHLCPAFPKEYKHL